MAILIERKRRRRRKETSMSPLCNLNETATTSLKLNQDDCLQRQPQQNTTCRLIPNMCISTNQEDSKQEMCSKMITWPQSGQHHQQKYRNKAKHIHPPFFKQHCKVRRAPMQDTKSFSLIKSAIIVTQLNRQSKRSSSLLLLLLVAFITTTSLTLSSHLNLIRLVSASGSSNSGSTSNASGGTVSINNNNTPPNQSLGNYVISSAPATSITTTNGKARYKTMYACEDRQLVMDCDYGSKINLIRANYGRFSITQCNEQGQLDLSTDCMSPITFRIMRERCQDKQKCSVNATNLIFGDKCPKTRKYLEVHFQCQTDLRISTSPPPSSSMEPDKVDVRNIPSSSGLPSHHVLYPAGGSSSILPPNNPIINFHHQPSQNKPYLVSPEFEPPVQSRPGFQPTQSSFQPQQIMTVMNSDILTYNSIPDLKTLYNPNNISVDPAARLNDPIIVTLRHNHTENMHNPRCVLWDQSASQWTQKGSRIIHTNMTHTVCAFDQATSYLLVMDYIPPSSFTISPNPLFSNPTPQLPVNPPTATQPQVPSDFDPSLLEAQPTVFTESPNKSPTPGQQQTSSTTASSIVKFFSLFGYLLAFLFIAIAFMTIAFITSTMRSSAGAALKSLGNFTAFSGPKYKNRRTDGNLHNKDLLVVNNQNGHQFLYAPANTTKINSSSSTHVLANQHQGTIHQMQQQQQLYSGGNGTMSNLSGTGGQSNNYYYSLMGLFQQQQQQSQLQHHLSQHHLNQHQTSHQQHPTLTPASYHHQANKSTISNESANSTPSSSGVESGSASIQQQQQQQQACLMMNSDFNFMNPQISNYGQNQNLLTGHQPTLTLNAHYSSSDLPINTNQRLNLNNPMREHIYECVDDDKNYTARLLIPSNMNSMNQFSSNTLSNQLINQQQSNSSRAMTLSSRLLQQQQQLLPINQNNQTNKRLFSHPSVVHDNQPGKTNIICSKMVQVTPQRATEISNLQQHDIMTIYNSNDTTTTTTNSDNYGRPETNGLGGLTSINNKLSTDC